MGSSTSHLCEDYCSSEPISEVKKNPNGPIDRGVSPRNQPQYYPNKDPIAKGKISVMTLKLSDTSNKVSCEEHYVIKVDDKIYGLEPGTNKKCMEDINSLNIKDCLNDTSIIVDFNITPDDIRRAFDAQQKEKENSTDCQCNEFINKCLIEAGRRA